MAFHGLSRNDLLARRSACTPGTSPPQFAGLMREVMKMKVAYRFLTYAAVVTLLAIPSFRPAWGADALVIGDGSDNSLKRFDAASGAFQGTLIKSQGGLHGPRGL